jgi:CheY-like chemotaxis protein
MQTDATVTRLRAVVVDDEAPARAVLREYLGAHPDVEIVAECANGFEAVKAVTELRPDLLFLDVQMPKLDGFEVLDLVGAGPAVVFVTAYDEYALRAFDVHAVDYLLKPVFKERLERCLDRLRENRPARKFPAPVRAGSRNRGRGLGRGRCWHRWQWSRESVLWRANFRQRWYCRDLDTKRYRLPSASLRAVITGKNSMPLTHHPEPEEVDCLIRNAELRDEIKELNKILIEMG